KNLNKAYELGIKHKSPAQKMDAINEQYDILNDFYKASKKARVEQIQKMDISQDEMEKQLQKFGTDFFINHKKYTHQLLDAVEDIFKSASFPVRRVTRTTGELEYDAFILFPSENASRSSLSALNRYQKNFGVEIISFDLVENIGSGMKAGFYREAKRLELGVNGIRSLVVENRIPMIPKHELHHAAFESRRSVKAKGDKNNSIYNFTFSAYGSEPLSSSVYDRYMSAEEIYNWANNSFWGSERLLRPSQHDSQDILTDVLTIIKYLPETKSLAEETVKLTKRLDRGYKNMLDEVEDGSFEVIFLNGDNEMARTMEEARYLMVPDVESKIHVREFIGPEYKKQVANILENRKRVEVEYAEIKSPDVSEQQLHELQVKKENELSKNEFIHIINKMRHKNAKLQKVSSVLSSESELTIRKTQEFLDQVKEVKDSTGLLPSLDSEKLLDLAREYRNLGNLVKEDYKGFAGR
ncbi:MAG: hypothetical protein KC478_07410, partial [Bacteriovoracaceae bacterium]|nr:hypothetical protein [Bacteriovoracaceae bacterium]